MKELQKLIWKEVPQRDGAYEVRHSDYVGLVEICPRGEFAGDKNLKWTVRKAGHLIALGYCQDNERAEQLVERVIDGWVYGK